MNNHLINVYNNTKTFFKNNHQSQSIKYEEKTIPKITSGFMYDSNKIVFLKENTIDGIIQLKQKNFNPLVLNMANNFIMGGGVEYGMKAQEETLFRCSNLFQELKEEFYPLKTFEFIYSPKVWFIKDKNYKQLKEKINCSVISFPAINNPYLTTEGKYKLKDEEIMIKKITLIFQTAILHNHDSVLLGAWGCGAFKNPVIDVAFCFKKVLEKYKFYFKEIRFSVNNNLIDIFKNIITYK